MARASYLVARVTAGIAGPRTYRIAEPRVRITSAPARRCARASGACTSLGLDTPRT